MIRRIEINNYKLKLGQNDDEHLYFKEVLPPIINANLLDLNAKYFDVYRLTGDHHSHGAGTIDTRVVVFANGTTRDASTEKIVVDIPEFDLPNVEILSPEGNGVLITTESGLVIAEWQPELYELNILFDVFFKYEAKYIDAFTYIMKKFNELVWIPKLKENSWKYSQDKTKLTERFIKQIKEAREYELRDARESIQLWLEQAKTHRQKIKTLTENIAKKMRYVDTESINNDKISSDLIKDLDLIIQHPKISDLMIKDNKFIITTEPLYITSDKEKRYYGGKYRIELEPNNTSIKFFGDTPRKSYWTNHDPHPHVNGETGEACLGNVGSTIAELCSQMQIYALVMIGIDFLESANTQDAAGKNVVRWDEVDENNNVLASQPRITCGNCGNLVEELFTVFENTYEDDEGNNHFEGEHQVCERCREEDYHFNEDTEVYEAD